MTEQPDDTTPLVADVHHNASPRSFARNVIFGYLTTFTSLLSGLVVTPVLYRSMGVDQFAAFGLVSGITGLALLADLGVGTATVRRIAAAVATDDQRSLWLTVRASRTLFSASGLLSFAGLALVAWRMPSWFSLPHGLASQAQTALLIAAAGQSISIALGAPTAVVIGHGRSDLLAKRGLAIGPLTAGAQCAVAALGGGVVGVSVVMAVSAACGASIGVLIQRRLLGAHDHNLEELGGKRDLLREGAANFVISIAGTVAFLSDTIVLGAIAPLAAIAAYTIAAKLPALVRILASKAIDLLQPTYSHLYATQRGSSDGALFRAVVHPTKFSVAAGVAAGIAASCSADFLLHAWVGNVPANTDVVLVLLMATMVLQMSGHSLYVLLTGVRRLKRLLIFSVLSAALNIGLSIWWTHDLGARGPALASLICVAIGDLFVLPLIVASVLGVGPFRVLRELTIAPLLPAVPVVGLAFVLRVPTRDATSLLVGAACGALYLALFWVMLGSRDRAFALGLFRRVVRARSAESAT